MSLINEDSRYYLQENFGIFFFSYEVLFHSYACCHLFYANIGRDGCWHIQSPVRGIPVSAQIDTVRAVLNPLKFELCTEFSHSQVLILNT